jgi:hypothetical protein
VEWRKIPDTTYKNREEGSERVLAHSRRAHRIRCRGLVIRARSERHRFRGLQCAAPDRPTDRPTDRPLAAQATWAARATSDTCTIHVICDTGAIFLASRSS